MLLKRIIIGNGNLSYNSTLKKFLIHTEDIYIFFLNICALRLFVCFTIFKYHVTFEYRAILNTFLDMYEYRDYLLLLQGKLFCAKSCSRHVRAV